MRALMRSAAADVFAQINASSDRDYVIRLSAMEIYNEVVRDLLPSKQPDATPTSSSNAAFGPGGAAASAAHNAGLKVKRPSNHAARYTILHHSTYPFLLL